LKIFRKEVSVKFPVLIIASDGWVDYIKQDKGLQAFNYIAIRKYNKLRPLIIDSDDSVWQVTEISPNKPLNLLDKILAYTFYHPLLPVSFQLAKITDRPFDLIKDALGQAIDADDDILTQWSDADELKRAVREANSFDALVANLKQKKAI
jgi:hypothetical protein